MINAIIVDDEPLARDVLEAHLSKIPEVNLIAKCDNAIEAREVLNNNDIDLVYLDIQMPQISGIEFVKSLTNPPSIIFTTAFDNYAVEGFELSAVDYLLKPISLERFLKATNKALEKIEMQHKSQATEVELTDDDFIFVKADKKLVKINFSQVLYIEGLKDYVIIKLEDKRVITLQTMKSLEAKLPSHIFLRIHRSYIVNMNKMDAIMGNMVELKEKGQVKHLPVGKNYRDELLAIVEEKKL
jgi:DNA-binding LytR/AlgR family response regulator